MKKKVYYLNLSTFNKNIITPIKKFLLIILMILVFFGVCHSIIYAYEKELNYRIESHREYIKEEIARYTLKKEKSHQ